MAVLESRCLEAAPPPAGDDILKSELGMVEPAEPDRDLRFTPFVWLTTACVPGALD